jgi:hypothetical protein
MGRLPPSFTSLYRLFLRASSASVLHQNAARKQLRRLFRPVFDAAARVVGDLQSNQLSRSERTRREHFLNIFQQRSTSIDYSLWCCLICHSGWYSESPPELCAVSRSPSSSNLQSESASKGTYCLDLWKVLFRLKECMGSKSSGRGQLKASCPSAPPRYRSNRKESSARALLGCFGGDSEDGRRQT